MMAHDPIRAPLLLVVSCLALLAAASARSLPAGDTPAGNYTSNTQQCIVSSPKLQACAHLPFVGNSATWWDMGGHLLECCSALREFNKPGCFWYEAASFTCKELAVSGSAANCAVVQSVSPMLTAASQERDLSLRRNQDCCESGVGDDRPARSWLTSSSACSNPTVLASDPAIGNLTKALDLLGPLCLFEPMTKDHDNCPPSLNEPGRHSRLAWFPPSGTMKLQRLLDHQAQRCLPSVTAHTMLGCRQTCSMQLHVFLVKGDCGSETSVLTGIRR